MLQTHRVRTLDQVRTFLDGAEPVEVQPLERSARYELVARTPRRGNWARPTRGARRFAGAEAAPPRTGRDAGGRPPR